MARRASMDEGGTPRERRGSIVAPPEEKIPGMEEAQSKWARNRQAFGEGVDKVLGEIMKQYNPPEDAEKAEGFQKVSDLEIKKKAVAAAMDTFSRAVRQLAVEMSDGDADASRAEKKALENHWRGKIDTSRQATGVALQNQKVEMEQAYVEKLQTKVQEFATGGIAKELEEAHAREKELRRKLDVADAKCKDYVDICKKAKEAQKEAEHNLELKTTMLEEERASHQAELERVEEMMAEQMEEVCKESLKLDGRLLDLAVKAEIDRLQAIKEKEAALRKQEMAFQKERAEAKKILEEVQQQLAAKVQELEQTQAQLEAVRAEYEQTKLDLSDQISKLEKEIKQLEIKIAGGQGEIAGVKALLKDTQEQLTKTKEELEATKATLEETKSELQQTKTDLEQTRAELAEAQKKIEALEAECQEKQAKIGDLLLRIDEHLAEIEEHKKAYADLQEEMRLALEKAAEEAAAAAKEAAEALEQAILEKENAVKDLRAELEAENEANLEKQKKEMEVAHAAELASATNPLRKEIRLLKQDVKDLIKIFGGTIQDMETETRQRELKVKMIFASSGGAVEKLMKAKEDIAEHKLQMQACKDALKGAQGEMEDHEKELDKLRAEKAVFDNAEIPSQAELDAKARAQIQEMVETADVETRGVAGTQDEAPGEAPSDAETISMQLSLLLARFKAALALQSADIRLKDKRLEAGKTIEKDMIQLKTKLRMSMFQIATVQGQLEKMKAKVKDTEHQASLDRATVVAEAIQSMHRLRAHLAGHHGMRVLPSDQLEKYRETNVANVFAVEKLAPLPTERLMTANSTRPSTRELTVDLDAPMADTASSRQPSSIKLNQSTTSLTNFLGTLETLAKQGSMPKTPSQRSKERLNVTEASQSAPASARAGPHGTQWGPKVLPVYHEVPSLRRADWFSQRTVEQRATEAIAHSVNHGTSLGVTSYSTKPVSPLTRMRSKKYSHELRSPVDNRESKSSPLGDQDAVRQSMREMMMRDPAPPPSREASRGNLASRESIHESSTPGLPGLQPATAEKSPVVQFKLLAQRGRSPERGGSPELGGWNPRASTGSINQFPVPG